MIRLRGMEAEIERTIETDRQGQAIGTTFSELYALIEKIRLYALGLSDPRFAGELRQLQRQLFVKKAELLKALEQQDTLRVKA